jgi:hypothetical protein
MNGAEWTRRRVSHEILIGAPSAQVFPLLCPVEELKWIDGWNFRMHYSKSGRNEPQCIFSERITGAHLFGAGVPEETCWITTAWQPERGQAQFVLMRGEAVSVMAIALRDEDGGTRVRFEMTMTGLDDEGMNRVAGAGAGMELMLSFLAQSLKHYCETGTMLRMGA